MSYTRTPEQEAVDITLQLDDDPRPRKKTKPGELFEEEDENAV